MSNSIKLEGSMTAIVTPFNKGKVDYPALADLIEFQIENGTQGLVPCGTTGESPTLSFPEHEKVVEFTVRKTRGRIPVIAGAGSNCTREAIELATHARKVGADACLIVNPYYNKPTQEGMFQHVKAVAKVGLPIVLYNIPGRCGVEMAVETVVRLHEQVPQVVAIKESTGKLDFASQVAAESDITIISGDDSLTLPICAVGGCGVISVLSNALPAEVRKLCDAITDFDMAAACTQHLKLFPLFKGIFVETNPIPIKAILAMMGMIKEELRLPLVPLSAKYRQGLCNMLKEFGVKARPGR